MYLSIKNLSKRYDNSKLALNNVNLDLNGKRIVGLFGPNGSGKTTMIKVLANLLMHYDGEISIDGFKPGKESKSIVAYLPDAIFLDPNQKVYDAVKDFQTFFADFDTTKACNLISRFSIDLNAKVRTLSKGNKEKLQLILVLSRNAKLFLFDEPIAGVDPASREIIFDLIVENTPSDATVIITTHLIIDIEKIVDHVVFINEGKIFLDEDKADLEAQYEGKTINDIFIELFKQQMYGGNSNVW